MKVVIDDYRLEKMDSYTDPLEAKIKRQAAQITRLLADNAELKKGREAIRDNAFEAGLIRGQEEAWELIRKIGDMYCSELDNIFDSSDPWEIVEKYTYSEAAAKVAEWERKKEEICMGDVVRFKSNNSVEFCVTNILDDRFLYGVSAEGDVYADRNIKLFEKTGRHIDVDAWLAQIGGESDE